MIVRGVEVIGCTRPLMTIDDRIVGGRFRNDRQFTNDEGSKSAANNKRYYSRFGPAGSKVEAVLRGTRDK